MGLLSRLFPPVPSGSSKQASIRGSNTQGVPDRLRESYPNMTTEDWYWGRASATGNEEDYFWRRLSDNWPQKDVLPGTYLEIHNQVYEAYNANPMANAIIEMGTNFVLGDGLQVDCRHKKVQALLDRFWNDPDNRMAIRQFDLATELALYGELFIRFFVNPFNGHVKIAQIDPSLIDEIHCDPDNIEKQLRCHRRPVPQSITADARLGPGVPSGQDPQPGIAMPGADLSDQKGDWYSMPDQVAHFAINKVSNAKRGKSDLATLLPWLRRYKDWLIDRVRINKYKAAFLWDVTLSGADRKTIEQRMMELSRPPEPGSVLVHNESEAWTAVQPRIDATSVAADGQAIKMMIAMGAGLPEHYLSDGGNVNRATAGEMSLPTLKRYQRRQDYFGYLIRQLLDRVIAEAQKAGQLPKTIDTDYHVVFPELHVDDAQTAGTAAYYMSQALATVTQLGIVSHETASKLFFEFAREEVDANQELDRIEQERKGAGWAPPPVQDPAAPKLVTPQTGGSMGGARSSVRPSGNLGPEAGLHRPDKAS